MPRRKDNPEPWERQFGEGFKAYAAFDVYLLLGPDRNHKDTASHDTIERSVHQIRQWSKRWRWVERACLWDDKLAEERRLKAEVEIQKMHARHAQEAMLLQAKCVEALKLIEDGKFPKSVIHNALKVGIETERVARGEPGKVEEIREVASEDQIDLSQLSDEEFADFKRLYDKAAASDDEKGDPKEEPS